jgi:putative hydrolase of the HAD superfamily
MGVIYQVGDDVADLLVPFIREKNGVHNVADIQAAYLRASLGQIETDEFWQRVRIPPELEDEYLTRLTLSSGLHEFLQSATTQFERIVCLSNDVPRWSRKLRQRFELESHINDWYISGDLGIRKPDARIYDCMLADLGVAAAQVLFVDDRPKNLDPAADIGIQTVYFDPDRIGNRSGHRTVAKLIEVLGK